MMTKILKTLFTEDEYREALKRFLEICDTAENTPEAEELEVLMTVMEIYERENCS
jgi:antitoxin component HigA of HigAB toxin-antitoxin module